MHLQGAMLRLGALLRLSSVAQPAKATKTKAAKENQARGKCGKSAKKAAPQKHAQPQKVPMSIQVSDDDASTEADPSGVCKVRTSSTCVRSCVEYRRHTLAGTHLHPRLALFPCKLQPAYVHQAPHECIR